MGRVIEKLDEEIRSLSPGQKVGLLRSLITELDAPIDLDVEQLGLKMQRGDTGGSSKERSG